MNVQFGPHRVQLVQGDITRQVVDAIVNAANSAPADRR
jgi:O-acetyl-ADP-ribose deacetylase (regulator of RNase III)